MTAAATSSAASDAEHIADVVEAFTDVILRKLVGRREADAEQIANSVVVFGAVESVQGGATWVLNEFAIEVVEFVVEQFRDVFEGLFIGHRAVISRGHGTGIHHAVDLFPASVVAEEV
jgi:hypothetical protein